MLQSTLTRGTHLAHKQRLIDRRKLHANVRARAIARVNAKRLGRQPPACNKPKDYPLADDSFWAVLPFPLRVIRLRYCITLRVMGVAVMSYGCAESGAESGSGYTVTSRPSARRVVKGCECRELRPS
jgi:hypothetical protein